MNDRELIEKAAKAAGIVLHVWGTPGKENFGDMGTKERWNPLTDDADAFRLAVKLGLNVLTCGREGAETMEIQVGGAVPRTTFQPVGHEGREAATRRAIVRAAAAIGEKQ